MTKQSTPALRFDGFDGEWSETTLEQLFEYGGSGGTPSKSRPEFYGGSIPFLGIADIKDRVITHTEKTITELGLKNSAAWKIPEGAISLAMYASVGRVGIAGMELATSQAFYNMVFADEATRNFVFACLAKMESMSEWEAQISTGTQRNLNAFKVRTFPIKTPFSLEEQRAIGELFADLDALIEQHRAKHANLQQTKTALLQRMFPQDGADEPELRLGGSSNPWVLRHLGEFEITTGPFGSTLHAEDYVEHGTPIVTTEHFKSGLLPLTGQGVPQVSDDDRRRLKAYWLQTDDIVFSRVGSVDINARVTELQNGWLFSGRVLRVRPDATCESEFLHSVLETTPVRGSIRKRAVGMSMPSINTAILANTSFYQPPTLEEQRAVGEVFSNLDALIAAESRYITQLTQAKTALLQRMFV